MLGMTSLESKKDSLSGIRIDYIMADSSAAGVLELLPKIARQFISAIFFIFLILS
jgi:hypothetical protein